jgi:alkylation response protein AidB-like acyl-CoA dehydrogenase
VEDGAFYGQPHSEPVEQGETDTRLGAGGRRFGTTARRVDGGYVVNGRKFFVSLAGCAPYYATPAIRLGEEPWIERTLYLQIPKDAPGVSFPGEWDPMGMRATVSRDMVLQDVFVPDDAEVLPPGLFGAMYNAFPHLFLSFSATFLGLMQAAYDGALAYLTGRMPGAPIPHTEIAAKGHAIAEMLFAIESARALLPGNLGGPGRCSAGGGPARPRGARHRATRGSHGHPGGDPCLWRTGLPQALSARALRTRRAGRGTHAPVDSGDRDAAGLGGRAWLGRAAGRCCRGVTVLPSVARKTAHLCRRSRLRA